MADEPKNLPGRKGKYDARSQKTHVRVLRPRKSTSGEDVDRVIAEARKRYEAGVPEAVGAGSSFPESYTALGVPATRPEVIPRRDGKWTIIRNKLGKATYAFKHHGKFVLRMTQEQKSKYLLAVGECMNSYLSANLISVDHRLVEQELGLDPEFAYQVKCVQKSLTGWGMHSILEATKAGNLQAATTLLNVRSRDVERGQQRKRFNKEFALKEREIDAKLRLIEVATDDLNPSLKSLDPEELKKWTGLHVKIRAGEPLSDDEFMDLGKLGAKLGAAATTARVQSKVLGQLTAMDAAIEPLGDFVENGQEEIAYRAKTRIVPDDEV